MCRTGREGDHPGSSEILRQLCRLFAARCICFARVCTYFLRTDVLRGFCIRTCGVRCVFVPLVFHRLHCCLRFCFTFCPSFWPPFSPSFALRFNCAVLAFCLPARFACVFSYLFLSHRACLRTVLLGFIARVSCSSCFLKTIWSTTIWDLSLAPGHEAQAFALGAFGLDLGVGPAFALFVLEFWVTH